MWRLWFSRRRLCLITPQTGEQGTGKRVLLIAPYSSYRIAPYLDAARRLGIELLVVSEGRHSLVSEIAEGLHVDFAEPEAAINTILAAARKRPVHGVLGCDDATVELAARVAESLGLVSNPPGASRISRRKDLARQCLADAGIPVPDFTLIDTDLDIGSQLDTINFPSVVKPVSLSGSRAPAGKRLQNHWSISTVLKNLA